jgi:hypothetical protein
VVNAAVKVLPLTPVTVTVWPDRTDAAIPDGKVISRPVLSTEVNDCEDVTVKTFEATCVEAIGMTVPVNCWILPFESIRNVRKNDVDAVFH